jgi:hypothetical protein
VPAKRPAAPGQVRVSEITRELQHSVEDIVTQHMHSKRRSRDELKIHGTWSMTSSRRINP